MRGYTATGLGINTETSDKIKNFDRDKQGASSRQLDLTETPVATCPVCGYEILQSDNFRSQDKWFECQNCEKVVNVKDL